MNYLDYRLTNPTYITSRPYWFYLTRKINYKSIIYDYITIDKHGICLYSNQRSLPDYYPSNGNKREENDFLFVLQSKIFKHPLIKEDESSIELKHFVIMVVLKNVQ